MEEDEYAHPYLHVSANIKYEWISVFWEGEVVVINSYNTDALVKHYCIFNQEQLIHLSNIFQVKVAYYCCKGPAVQQHHAEW